MEKAKRSVSKPMLVWLGFNGLVLLWFLVSQVLRLRLVFWYDKWYSAAILIVVLMVVFFGWSILGLLWLLPRSKILCAIASLLPGAVAVFLVVVMLPGMVLGLGMASSAKWRTDYFLSPEGTNTAVVFFGGDAGATTRGPYYAVYPLVCKGVYRYSKGNETERVPLSFYEYIPPDIEWLSEREARMRIGIQEIVIDFRCL